MSAQNALEAETPLLRATMEKGKEKNFAITTMRIMKKNIAKFRTVPLDPSTKNSISVGGWFEDLANLRKHLATALTPLGKLISVSLIPFLVLFPRPVTTSLSFSVASTKEVHKVTSMVHWCNIITA